MIAAKAAAEKAAQAAEAAAAEAAAAIEEKEITKLEDAKIAASAAIKAAEAAISKLEGDIKSQIQSEIDKINTAKTQIEEAKKQIEGKIAQEKAAEEEAARKEAEEEADKANPKIEEANTAINTLNKLLSDVKYTSTQLEEELPKVKKLYNEATAAKKAAENKINKLGDTTNIQLTPIETFVETTIMEKIQEKKAAEEAARKAAEEAARKAAEAAQIEAIKGLFEEYIDKNIESLQKLIGKTTDQDTKAKYETYITTLKKIIVEDYDDFLSNIEKKKLADWEDVKTKMENKKTIYENINSEVRVLMGATQIVITMRDMEKEGDKSNQYRSELDKVVFGLDRNDNNISKYQNSHPDGTTPPDNYIIIPKGQVGICKKLQPNDMGVLLDGNGIYGPFGEIYSPKPTGDGPSPYQIYEYSLKKSKSKITSGNNVIIFGFGFSGSGKTYSLVEADDSIVIKFISDLGVDKVNLSVQEFYPYVEGGDMEQKTTDFNEYVPGFEKPIKFTLNSDDNFKTDGDLSFKDILKEIELARFNNMHITPTPNNPVSSRGHLFYTFSFPGTNFGAFIIMDMAGTENTIQIKEDLYFKNDITDTPNDGAFTNKEKEPANYSDVEQTIQTFFAPEGKKFFSFTFGEGKKFFKKIIDKFIKFIDTRCKEVIEFESEYFKFLQKDENLKEFCNTFKFFFEREPNISQIIEGIDDNYIKEFKEFANLVMDVTKGENEKDNIKKLTVKINSIEELKKIKSPIYIIYYFLIKNTEEKIFQKQELEQKKPLKVLNENIKSYFLKRYINIVVNQGRGIVTTLEHLKFFFLKKAGGSEDKRLNEYNDKGKKLLKDDKGKKLLKDENFNFDKGLLVNEETLDRTGLETDLQKNSVTYNKNSGGAIEEREMGLMEQVGFIEKLASCGGSQDPKIQEIKSKLIMPETENSIYIMLGCILRGHSSDDTKTEKYCQATFDTLELCQALSSKKNAVGERFEFTGNKISVNEFELTITDNIAKLPPKPSGNSGGGIKTRKNKKPRKQNKIKTRKNQY